MMSDLTPAIGRAERSDALANRERILEAAREVFARRGLEAEIREIAERAGLGVGTLYRHFECREGLLATLLQQAKGDMLRRLQVAVQTDEPKAALRAMLHAGAWAYEQFGALTEALLTGRLDHLHSGHAEFTELLTGLLERGMEEGIFRSDLDVAVACAAVESLFISGKLVELGTQRSYGGAADALADFLLRAIAR